MFRFPGEIEQLEIMERLQHAIEDKKPVTVSFFKEKEITHTYTVKGVKCTTTYTGYVKVRRTVEPWLVGFHQSDGHPYVRVISRSPTDEKGPMYRTIRLDRIAVRTTTGKPLLTVHAKGKRYCQGLINVAEAKEAAKLATAH